MDQSSLKSIYKTTDFDIFLSKKTSFPKIKNIVLPPAVKKIGTSCDVVEIQEVKNFILKRAWFGLNYTIVIPNRGVEYSHDEVVEAARKILESSAKKSWENYGYYTSSNKWPSWADKFIRSIDV